MRFIDMASHGGCSKKMEALSLDSMLGGLANGCASSDIKHIFSSKSDAGIYDFHGRQLASTVDIISPMVISPLDFGVISIVHALSDLYAVGAKPLFALSILGLPKGVDANNTHVANMMRAAIDHLSSNGIALMGGHSLIDQEDLSLGFCVIGEVKPTKEVQIVKEGDPILLTKRLGTSIATGFWKSDDLYTAHFQDVLEGMKQSNALAAEGFGYVGINASTDVTGYGFLGHLINLMKRWGCSALVETAKVPIYDSLSGILHEEIPQSRQIYSNYEYAEPYVDGLEKLTEAERCILLDAQVSGGLLAVCPRERLSDFRLAYRGKLEICEVGSVAMGKAGGVRLI